jgi:hypothetical protein
MRTRGVRSGRRRLLLAASISVFAAAVFFALRGDGRGGFWATLPLLGSLVSGLILFAILGFGVERFLDYRDKMKWRQLAALACHTLGDSGSRPMVTELAAVYVAPDDDLTQYRRPSDSTGDLHPLTSALPIEEGKTIWALNSPSLPSLDFAQESLVPPARLRYLLHDEEWLEFAIGRFQPLRHQIRATLAPWASIMILSHEPRALLNALASLNDDFGYFRVELEVLACSIRAKGDPDEIDERVEDAIARWQLLDARARLLTNALWRVAEVEQWSYELPVHLREMSLDAAFKTQDRIGDWKPPTGSG